MCSTLEGVQLEKLWWEQQPNIWPQLLWNWAEKGKSITAWILDASSLHTEMKSLDSACNQFLFSTSPCVIDNNCDLDVVAKRILFGKFVNAGQVLCVLYKRNGEFEVQHFLLRLALLLTTFSVKSQFSLRSWMPYEKLLRIATQEYYWLVCWMFVIAVVFCLGSQTITWLWSDHQQKTFRVDEI